MQYIYSSVTQSWIGTECWEPCRKGEGDRIREGRKHDSQGLQEPGNLVPRGRNPSGLLQGPGCLGYSKKTVTKVSESDWLLKTCLFHHNRRHTRTIKPETRLPGSGFGFSQSRWVSRPLIKGNAGSGNKIGNQGEIEKNFCSILLFLQKK